LIVIWSRCLHRHLPTNGGQIRLWGIDDLQALVETMVAMAIKTEAAAAAAAETLKHRGSQKR